MAQRKRMGKDFWHLHIDAWASSGLTQADYCARQGLSLKTFARWRTNFLKAASKGKTTSDVPRHSRLVPVIVDERLPAAAPSSDGPVCIRADGQPWVVTIGPGVDAKALKAVLNLLLPGSA